MKIIRFPKTIKLELSDVQRALLDGLIERRPQFTDDHALLGHVIVEGIFATLQDNSEPVEGFEPPPTMAERMKVRLEEMADDVAEPAEVKTAATLPPFPRATRRYRSPRKKYVENYVACSVTEDMRQRLQLLLDSQPELDLEKILAKLLDLGLDQTEQDTGALKTNHAEVFENTQNESKLVVPRTMQRAARKRSSQRRARLLAVLRGS
ncbi:MAG: hypothetical protein WDO69_32585 [Pseudomonadota bacterium]